MKRLIELGLLLCTFLLLVSCQGSTSTTVADLSTLSSVQQATLEIEGMTCQSCALGVEYELKQVDGVVDAKVDYSNGMGVVTFDGDKVDAQTIAKASTVYPAKVVSNNN